MGMSILYPLSYFVLRGERGQLLGPGAPQGGPWGPRGTPGEPWGTPGNPGDPWGPLGNWLLGSTQPLVGWKHATTGWLLGSTQPLVGWKHATIGRVEKVDPVSLVP